MNYGYLRSPSGRGGRNNQGNSSLIGTRCSKLVNYVTNGIYHIELLPVTEHPFVWDSGVIKQQAILLQLAVTARPMISAILSIPATKTT